MMILRKSIFYVILPPVMLAACNPHNCINFNPIFDQFPPTANEYKRELVSQINKIGNSKLKYRIADFSETDSCDYLILDVQGRDVCAKGYFRIIDPEGLEEVIRTKGKGYRGARIKGFQFMVKEGENIELIVSDLKSIID